MTRSTAVSAVLFRLLETPRQLQRPMETPVLSMSNARGTLPGCPPAEPYGSGFVWIAQVR